MHVQRQSKDKVTVVMSRHEAQRLLAAVHDHRDVLGPAAAEIEQALAALGVALDDGPEHIAYEHPPFKD